MPRTGSPIERVDVSACVVPTDQPESDGTLRWTRTVVVVVEVTSAGSKGVGYTYADAATASVVQNTLVPVVLGRDVLSTNATYDAMFNSVRNLGRDGIAAMAISAVDIALWDLKAHLLDVSLVCLLGRVRDRIAVYGSGGFTSYDQQTLESQLRRWIEQGFTRVKMKVGRKPSDDVARVRGVRSAIGNDAELFVDANGGYQRKQALALAERFAELGVTWLEEPVSSDDLEGLHLLRDRAPASIEIAAGEYGYDLPYFERMLRASAVDVLQIDATRCGGVTGFLRAAAIADAHGLPISSHCAPAVHAHLDCACTRARHLEYFHDHARIERLLFEGALQPVDGMLQPDGQRAGLGLSLRRDVASRYSIGAHTTERRHVAGD